MAELHAQGAGRDALDDGAPWCDRVGRVVDTRDDEMIREVPGAHDRGVDRAEDIVGRGSTVAGLERGAGGCGVDGVLGDVAERGTEAVSSGVRGVEFHLRFTLGVHPQQCQRLVNSEER